MSNALAVGAVSVVLKDRLHNELTPIIPAALAPVKVTVLPPDRITTGVGEESQLNLFLYHVASNNGWSSVGLPSRDTRGERLTNPPLGLNLHYLLSAYGARDFHPEILLGCGMQVFHETPILSRQTIRNALPSPPAGSLPLDLPELAATGLADQIELIKIAPESLNTEEISKLWTALQTHYRPTAAYQVTVVLIEAKRPTRSALPVRDRTVITVPFAFPRIDSVSPQIAAPGGTLTIQGQSLRDNVTQVKVDSILVPPVTVSDSQVTAALPGTLLAGIHTVQVVHGFDFGTPTEPHRGFESNLVAFMLAPTITTVPPITVVHGAVLTLSFTPPIGRDQLVSLFIADRGLLLPPRPPTDPPTSASADFAIPATFPAGDYLLRVRVDGAESALTVDTNPASPTFNQYIAPKLAVT